MKLRDTSVWERAPGEAAVELVVTDPPQVRVVKLTADLDVLEEHANKCLQVAREMRRRKGVA